ncbi:hypothetical protein [Thiorhodospira sibirica]|uniref:hypothetical protein n=1 Tax=Thiorhodospira sibirica TaxID=154347 RepID=UPI00022C5283|nr:hypothetical protein [Thiorhodospira sibirica]
MSSYWKLQSRTQTRQALWQVIISLLISLLPVAALAQTLILQPGERWQDNGLQIYCAPERTTAPEHSPHSPRPPGKPLPHSAVGAPIVLESCQYWDDFKRSCLFEQRTHHLGALQCVEECQHWDEFARRCLFQTQCTYHPDSRRFVRTQCERFDSFSGRCLHTQDQLLQPAR